MGVVGNGPDGRPDPVRRVLTFTTAALTSDTEICGPMKLVLYARSSATDTDFVVKISEQFAADGSHPAVDQNPRYQIVSKGWLRASHRALDTTRSTELAPVYLHTKPELLTPGQTYRFEIAVMPSGHRFKRGSRIRLELSNGDSSVTEYVFTHEYAPWKVGQDVILHDRDHPSHLLIPIRNINQK